MWERTVDADKPKTVAIADAEYPSSRILFISDFSCMVILYSFLLKASVGHIPRLNRGFCA
jgi:hypothetical protein